MGKIDNGHTELSGPLKASPFDCIATPSVSQFKTQATCHFAAQFLCRQLGCSLDVIQFEWLFLLFGDVFVVVR